MDLLVTTWPTLEHTTPNEHETAITRRFGVLLRRSQLARQLPFVIDREVPIDDEVTSAEVGRLDLRFVHGYRPDVYLTFEGKRVNVIAPDGRVHRRTSEYVSEGMMRFVGGQYSRRLQDGGMIAYVMDGDAPSASTALESALVGRRAELRLVPDSGLDECPLRPGNPSVRQTLHDLPGRPFRILHLVLPVARSTTCAAAVAP